MADVGLPLAAIRDQIADAIDLVVRQERGADGVRRVVEVAEVVRVAGGPAVRELFAVRAGRPAWRAPLGDSLAGRPAGDAPAAAAATRRVGGARRRRGALRRRRRAPAGFLPPGSAP